MTLLPAAREGKPSRLTQTEVTSSTSGAGVPQIHLAPAHARAITWMCSHQQLPLVDLEVATSEERD